MYDAIVVGGRLAGAATAAHLARRGQDVLVLERDTFPKDVLSTHFMWPRGASYLNRLGLLDRIAKEAPLFDEVDVTIEGIRIRGGVAEDDLRARFRELHGHDSGVVNVSFSARRHLLDDLLSRHATACGADIRQNARVTGLVQEDGRVTGVVWRQGLRGPEQSTRARVVIGADGRRSAVARLVGSPYRDVRRNCTFACYTYFPGRLVTAPVLQRRGRLGIALSPTSGGETMVLVYGPSEWYKTFRQDAEGNFARALDQVAPDLCALVREAGPRSSGLFMTDDQSAYIREPVGPGWALAGDAASFKDQCTASGMTHALRDAELIGQTLGTALDDCSDIETALSAYRDLRHLDSWKYYDFVASQAQMQSPQASELELLRSVAADDGLSRTFLGVFSDTVDPDRVFSVDSMQRILSTRSAPAPAAVAAEEQRNPFAEHDPAEHERLALTHTVRSFAAPVGSRLLERLGPFHQWYSARRRTETWLYSRTLTAAPGATTRLLDADGRALEGVNFASQDYLGLSNHPDVVAAAVSAISEYGLHSAGSAAAIGNTLHSRGLEQDVADLVEAEHVVLFPTGWAAAYGPVNALVRHYDHVVMDQFAHASLVQAAYAASRNVRRVPHLDNEAVRAELRDLRARDVRNGVLVITEGLFSMDADSPDLARLQDVCREYDATLLVDVAHDLGSTGPGGQGQLGIQKLAGQVDLVMGSFSKTFASNGGFVATRSAAVRSYIETYATSHVYSNALSPAQAATVRAALRIASSDAGARLRERVLDTAVVLRDALAGHSLDCPGAPGPIVPVIIGDERVARLTHRALRPRGVAAMVVEYPVVPSGTARLRLQIMPSHTPEQARQAAAAVADAVAEARATVNGPTLSPRK
ncbi:aminotransferase class I/II-fold pyridoxal phosphate-dependent enzyme (plasmid) [Kitasatospora sp. NBC_00070]|uniref:aminotransferase class I/II-fold pyridoxal phosphate-dependent enzyme n=1 Tax=Kitasatospora sp. NBC_00070 TaxID=2975962 RepID=UPI002F914CCD